MLLYIAHPLGRDPVKRPENIHRVQRWFRFLIDYGPDSWSYSVPWLIYAQNLDEDTYRPRGIRDGQVAISRHDGIVLVGGEISAGMTNERDIMAKLGRGICSLIDLGPEPPWEMDRASASQLVMSRMAW